MAKKRKVGRPKKRGRKKKYYKPVKKRRSAKSKNKGFGTASAYNRVRKLLWSRFKEDFNSYREFVSNQTDEQGNKIPKSSIPSQVYAQCKDIQCTDEDIINIYISTRGQEQGDIPLIPETYFDQTDQQYWTLLTENFYDGLDDRLWIVSPMLLNQPPYFLGVQGEDFYVNENNVRVDIQNRTDAEINNLRLVRGKKYRFESFVNYCNLIQQQSEIDLDSYSVPHWKFIGKEDNPLQAYWNDEMQRWEIELVPCTSNGEINDFEFNPDDLTPEPPDDFILPTPEQPDEPDEPTPPTRTLEEVQIEQAEKTGKLERLEMKKAGILKEIDTYINMGDRGDRLLDGAIDRLNKVNEEIDQID